VSTPLPLLVVSSGEPAGIGPDIALALASRPFAARLAALGDPELLAARAKLLGLNIALEISNAMCARTRRACWQSSR
jgi:4-hydroxythreonine-4-phosphate dehydrogenase